MGETNDQSPSLVDRQRALIGITRAVAAHRDREALFRAVGGAAAAAVEFDRMVVMLPAEDPEDVLVYAAEVRGGEAQWKSGTRLPRVGIMAGAVLDRGEPVVISTLDDDHTYPVSHEVLTGEDIHSLCGLPLLVERRCIGALIFMSRTPAHFDAADMEFFAEIAQAVAVALDSCLAYEEIFALKDRLALENRYLQEELQQEHDFEEIVGTSGPLRRALKQVELVAPTDTTVLILGETGTGKELIARAIHSRSPRRDRALVKVNCAAISAGLVESELFGHEKGAFTGALRRREGRFELAHGGTIFLDEIGELPLDTQVKLLRVLQEREFERVGGTHVMTVDARVIAATNRDLGVEAQQGRFREDLFYRLNVFPITMPPLRERVGDIALLIHFFVARFARRLGKALSGVQPEAMRQLQAYGWPGNVRELANVIERAVIVAPGPVLRAEDLLGLDPAPGAAPAATGTLEEVEREYIRYVLDETGWVIEGEQGAATRLDLHPNTLRSRLKKLGIERPKAPSAAE